MKMIPFSFENMQVRAADKDGTACFVLMDVCAALGLTNPTMAAKGLEPDELAKFHLGGQEGDVLIVTEAGLWRLVFRSNKPVAKRLQKWVFAEVLPTIRKTGGYGIPDDIAEKIDRMYGIERMLSHKITELEKLARKIEARAIEDEINADGRRSAVTHASALTLLIEAGAAQKQRRGIVLKLSRALCNLDKDESHRFRCATTGVWLFHRSFAKIFMRHVGNDWVRDHNAKLAGQGVLRLVQPKPGAAL